MSDVQATPSALPAELGSRVMEAAPVVILLLDPDGTVRYANPNFEALSGFRLDEIYGKSWFEALLPPCDRDQIRGVPGRHDRRARPRTHLEGHAVDVAHDGAEGIRVARQRRPEIVLCDLGLPGLSGYDVARELAHDEVLRRTTLVALSGYAAPDDVARARAAGFGLHLAKPVNLERLRAVLGAA